MNAPQPEEGEGIAIAGNLARMGDIMPASKKKPGTRTSHQTTPVITLLSDFGHRDNYVGVMKGVILSICREARLVDLSHETAPGDVSAGAFLLDASVDYFPDGTVHLAVVDPGVGGDRRPIAVQAGETFLVGPDNGVLSLALGRLEEHVGRVRIVHLTSPHFQLPRTGRTFHGRDIFAPTAAHLASGVPIDRLGERIEDPLRLSVPTCGETAGAIVGEVVYIDRFGNLVTNIPGKQVERLTGERAEAVVYLGRRRIGMVRESYDSVDRGKPLGIVGGFGRLEISVRDGCAARDLAGRIGLRVRLATRKKAAKPGKFRNNP